MTIDFEQPNDGGTEDEGSNRIFIILAVGLAGLIVLGLVGIGGVFMAQKYKEQQRLAQITPLATSTLAVVEELPTATATNTPVPTTSSDDAVPTPTNTPVVKPTNVSAGGESGGGQGEEIVGTPAAISSTSTNTPVPVGTPVGNNEVPNTGFGGFELALIAIGLVAVLFVTRRLRHAA